jgi:hypothetical protein
MEDRYSWEGIRLDRSATAIWPPATSCFRHFRFMFQVFFLNIAKVNLGCCICCNGNIHVLQAYVLSVSDVSDICFKCFI